MPAAKNNQWWRLRNKSGRDKIFASPEALWAACEEYFIATEKRKWYKIEYKGTPPKRVRIPTETPFTLKGLCLYLGIDENTWQRYRKDEPYKDFWAVVAEIDKIIYIQKFEGAVVGAFNHNIIARDIGLAEKSILAGDPDNPLHTTLEVKITQAGPKIANAEEETE